MFLKDPGATLDYRIDWSGRVGEVASIVASSWSVAPAGEMSLSSPGIAGPVTFVWVAGGAPGAVYRLTNHVALSDGGADERTVVVRVEDR
jgi:hypothetical protein